ncbi:multicopper oxidase family protein [Adhaeribacter radiodurans]|uniref:Multicopper oxidase family protein n=1 Tax=Adhaeribacter radiodurans TaxID=2745197 RepID=A0A7L7L7F7_9BACT|nr:multicopper oxidase family protein [Adhaeribacter radiodurans]QMU28738.1 multicopper oxidase family protein [Adhaeribacter radiodurans]
MKANQNYYHLTASEFEWQVSTEKTIKAWGFNQQLPGPTLKARKGEELIVKVTNNLEQPTFIHWHGIRLPASMDGTGEVQKPILPGEDFEYRFIVPDAGTFWYHSHANETEQMERGMYGALIVEEETDIIQADADKVFMIDDMKLTAENEFTKPGWFIPRIIERHDGRQGDTLLINGKENPIIDMAAGQQERWRFINAASARYFVLHLNGKAFKVISTDGGLLEQSRKVTQLLITPGERYDIIAGPFAEGETIPLESLPYNRVTFLKPKQQQFATIRVGEQKPTIAVIPENLRKIELLAPRDASITRKVKLSVGPSLKNGMDFLVNNDVHVNDKPVNVGELQIWEVNNASLMDHPFHLHGFFFQVLEENGKALEYLAWKDTYNLPPRTKIKIAWVPDNRPGRWMYHCHILEHHAAGMMANFDVVDPANPDLNPVSSEHSCHVH